MKKNLLLAGVALIALLGVFSLQSCVKDSCSNRFTLYRPVFKSLTAVRQEIRSKGAEPLRETGKIYTYGNYIFLNEVNKGIHVIDNSNPAAPRNMNFIPIPGNVDIAVKGNYLYADCFSDIVVLNISDPANAFPVHFMDNVLKEAPNYWASATVADSVQVVVGYQARDTVVDCETYGRWSSCSSCFFVDRFGSPVFTTAAAASAPPSGNGGSMARFTIVNNYLYGVSSSSLYSINIETPSQPHQVSVRNIGWGIETIFPFNNKLFIGSTTGMFIFDISQPSSPVQQGTFSHVRSCDPVIADGQHAYVTLRSGTECQGFTNQLEVLDITRVTQPTMVRSYAMTNPHGLSKDGNLLFLCDGRAGLKIYNASNPASLQPIQTISGLETYDVIAGNGKALVVAKDGLYQYSYNAAGAVQLLSKISITQ